MPSHESERRVGLCREAAAIDLFASRPSIEPKGSLADILRANPSCRDRRGVRDSRRVFERSRGAPSKNADRTNEA